MMGVTYFLPCVYAFFACLGFCILLNIRGFGVIICGIGGGLGWLAYLLVGLVTDSVYLCSFVAAIVISVYSEAMARIRKYPVTGYLLLSFFPLVPGAGIYSTMEYCIMGNTQRFLEKGLETIGIAGCLAIGVLMVSSAVRMFFIVLPKQNL